ncbi:hypothetical protein Cus16_0751 [Curtobacterium sp. ER1/6]|nr:hypothetical protein Cus16_0751 [Curtobacterium sp. ER1/6]
MPLVGSDDRGREALERRARVGELGRGVLGEGREVRDPVGQGGADGDRVQLHAERGAEDQVQHGGAVVPRLGRGAGVVGRAAADHRHDRSAGEGLDATGEHPRHVDAVDPGLEGRGNRVVVQRRADHDDVGGEELVDDLLPECVGLRVDLFLCGPVGDRPVQRGALQVRELVDVQVAAHHRVLRTAGAPRVGERGGQRAGARVGEVGGGVDVQQGGHAPTLPMWTGRATGVPDVRPTGRAARTRDGPAASGRDATGPREEPPVRRRGTDRTGAGGSALGAAATQDARAEQAGTGSDEAEGPGECAGRVRTREGELARGGGHDGRRGADRRGGREDRHGEGDREAGLRHRQVVGRGVRERDARHEVLLVEADLVARDVARDGRRGRVAVLVGLHRRVAELVDGRTVDQERPALLHGRGTAVGEGGLRGEVAGLGDRGDAAVGHDDPGVDRVVELDLTVDVDRVEDLRARGVGGPGEDADGRSRLDRDLDVLGRGRRPVRGDDREVGVGGEVRRAAEQAGGRVERDAVRQEGLRRRLRVVRVGVRRVGVPDRVRHVAAAGGDGERAREVLAGREGQRERCVRGGLVGGLHVLGDGLRGGGRGLVGGRARHRQGDRLADDLLRDEVRGALGDGGAVDGPDGARRVADPGGVVAEGRADLRVADDRHGGGDGARGGLRRGRTAGGGDRPRGGRGRRGGGLAGGCRRSGVGVRRRGRGVRGGRRRGGVRRLGGVGRRGGLRRVRRGDDGRRCVALDGEGGRRGEDAQAGRQADECHGRAERAGASGRGGAAVHGSPRDQVRSGAGS